MIITYTPADDEQQTWDWDPDKELDDAAEEIEAEFRGTYEEFKVAVFKGGTRARRVLLWHLQRKVHPSLKFADLPRFEMGAVKVELGRDELVDMRRKIDSAGLDPTTKDMATAAIDRELATRFGDDGDGDGKGKAARSGSSAKRTQSKSPTT